jgi:uncharacterized protein YbaR (Trm112 family)
VADAGPARGVGVDHRDAVASGLRSATRQFLAGIPNQLVSDGARIAYPIRDGVPIMLASAARRLE